MSPKMVLMGDTKQKRPIKSRKTPKKAKNQKMSENSPNQKKQIRRKEEYSTKPEEKTYKTNKKPGIKKAQTHHRKERGNEEEKGAKNEETQNISNSDSKNTCEKSEKSNCKNSETISDQKPTASKMAEVPEEEMWPSPLSSKAAPGFKLEVPKKLTKGEKEKKRKAKLKELLNDEVMNMSKVNEVLSMKNDAFRPSPSGPSPSKSPPSSDKASPEPKPGEKSESEEKSESKEKSESERKKQRIMINNNQCLVNSDKCEIISDQKQHESEMSGRVKNICISDSCDSGFTWTRTDVLIRHLVNVHKYEKEIAREAALNYQIKSGASARVIKGLKEMNIENVLKEKLFEDSSADNTFADAQETITVDEEDSFSNAKPIGSSTQEGDRGVTRKRSDGTSGLSPDDKTARLGDESLLAEESISVLHGEDYSPSQECRIREQKAMMALLDKDETTDLFKTPGKSQPSQGTAPTPPAEQESPMDESDKMAEENEIIKDLENQLEKSQKTVTTYYDLNAQKNNENAKLRKEIEEIREELEKAESIKRANANLRNKNEKLTEENRGWHKATKALSTELEAYKRTPSLGSSENVYREEIAKLKKKLQESEDSKSKALKAAKDHQALNDKFQDTLQENKAEMEKMRERISKFEKEKCEDETCKHPRDCGKSHAGKKVKNCMAFFRDKCIFGENKCWNKHDEKEKQRWKEIEKKKMEKAKTPANASSSSQPPNAEAGAGGGAKQKKKEEPKKADKTADISIEEVDRAQSPRSMALCANPSRAPAPKVAMPGYQYAPATYMPQAPMMPHPPPGYQGYPMAASMAFQAAGPSWPYGVGQQGPWSNNQTPGQYQGKWQGNEDYQQQYPVLQSSETDLKRFTNIQADNVSKEAALQGVEREMEEIRRKKMEEVSRKFEKKGKGE